MLPLMIIRLAFIISTVSHVASAFDQCDVRGKFVSAKECKNKLPDSKCDHYARLGYCIGQTYENMFIQCKRSCGFCIAPDLYEEIPKRTCFPERNQKYDRKVQAKLDCGSDKNCAAVVEGPKRRNQNKKSPYGNFSLTEKEYVLCNYPLATKATDDTLMFKKRGPSAACAHENIKDLSSYESMTGGGWNFEGIIDLERLVLPRQTCDAKLHRIKEYNWIVQQWIPSKISTTFWGSGRVSLKFNNCNNQGEVTVFVDGTEIAKSKSVGGETTATFNVEEESVLEIKADNRAIIRLLDLQIDCGVSATTLETRPAFDGYKYHENEYCSEPTYDNSATTIREAVTKCTNDPDCAAIEDKWATGKPPIGLCKRKKGKRAGGGTYLLKKDVPAQDGSWTEWTPWTSCSHSCKPPVGDLALKTRQRTCSNPPPALGGESCKGDGNDVELCNQNIPCPCVWAEWEPWGLCSKTCGDGGSRQRTRVKVRVESNGGTCNGEPTETELDCGYDLGTNGCPLACQAIATAVGRINVGAFYNINSNYAAGGTSIGDGGNDMYDTGNCITVPGSSSNGCTSNRLTYLQNCGEGIVNGQSYSMSMKNNGISVVYFASYTENTISINGNLGADGSGSVASGSYTYNGWKGFWKVVSHAGDPGINHLWITNAPNAYHRFDGTRHYDYDQLLGVNGHKVVYLMWGSPVNRRSSDSAMRQLIQAVSRLGI